MYTYFYIVSGAGENVHGAYVRLTSGQFDLGKENGTRSCSTTAVD